MDYHQYYQNLLYHLNNQLYCKSDGPYGKDPHIIQGFHPLPEYAGNYPLVGCWLVASKAAGLGIREDKTLVTNKNARFVPHIIFD